MINYEQLTDEQRTLRQHIRNAFLVATPEEAKTCIQQRQKESRWFEIACILEIMGE